MNNYYSEYQQRELFIKQHEKRTLLIPEVPVFSRSVDLVEYDQLDQKITAIEFKKKNWRKVIEQVKQVDLCFDYLEICIVSPKTIDLRMKIINTCKKDGIGLYFFYPAIADFKHVVIPTQINNNWEVPHEDVINYLESLLKNEVPHA